MKFVAEITSGPHQGKKFETALFPISIGRLKNNHIPISFDRHISRTHCIIYRDEGGLFITDMKSKNGTYVNNTLITSSIRICAGDIITLGYTNLRLLSLS